MNCNDTQNWIGWKGLETWSECNWLKRRERAEWQSEKVFWCNYIKRFQFDCSIGYEKWKSSCDCCYTLVNQFHCEFIWATNALFRTCIWSKFMLRWEWCCCGERRIKIIQLYLLRNASKLWEKIYIHVERDGRTLISLVDLNSLFKASMEKFVIAKQYLYNIIMSWCNFQCDNFQACSLWYFQRRKTKNWRLLASIFQYVDVLSWCMQVSREYQLKCWKRLRNLHRSKIDKRKAYSTTYVKILGARVKVNYCHPSNMKGCQQNKVWWKDIQGFHTNVQIMSVKIWLSNIFKHIATLHSVRKELMMKWLPR